MSAIDKLFTGLRISASGLSAERARMDVIAENMANARTTRTAEGGAYRRKMVVFEPILGRDEAGRTRSLGVRAAQVVEDHVTPMEIISDPGNPDADAAGNVELPNVNTLREMADLITSMRAYEAGISMQEAMFRSATRALELAR
jgi:flagellar basal-body rod protein FlgC